MSIHIITHCYASALQQYARHLHCQLSSLVVHKPDVPIQITICMSYVDHRTIGVINWFRDNHPTLNLHTLMMGTGHLFRRSIGRNLAGQKSKAELTWFTDVDHCFYKECLDTLWGWWCTHATEQVALVYPNEILIHEEHKIGDDAMSEVDLSRLVTLDESKFVVKKYNRAIGGVQIVPRWLLNETGYLRDNEAYQRPYTDAETKPFPCFRDDIVFRQQCKTKGDIVPIKLPNLFRIRHTETTYHQG